MEAAKAPVVTPSATGYRSSSPIGIENAVPGSAGWKLVSNGLITGYADTTSVGVRETVRFAVSTMSASFKLDIYRLGWYAGAGGRLMLSVDSIPGSDQGHWIGKTFGVAGCPTCEADPVTGLIDANWAWSYSLTIPPSWTSGLYIARLTTIRGDRGSIPFVVRDDDSKTNFLAVLPVNTWQAYNYWGGNSLYTSVGVGGSKLTAGKRAVKVSFNRPYVSPAPTPQDLDVIAFLERFGYDVSYATDIDIDRNPIILARHHLYISIGHDEYWSKAMRDETEAARDRGLSLAFLGGNDVYWQARYESDAAGTPRRTLVVYRSTSLDPAASTDPQTTTVTWADPYVNRPQNGLTGTLFSNGYPRVPEPWRLAISAPTWLTEGTNLRPGDMIPGLEQGECDRSQPNDSSPPSLQVLGDAHFTASGGDPERCETTWYQTNYQSAVFSAGDTGWPLLLAGSTGDQRVIRLTRNVLDRLDSLAAPSD